MSNTADDKEFDFFKIAKDVHKIVKKWPEWKKKTKYALINGEYYKYGLFTD